MKIPLTQGKFALVDARDFASVAGKTWHAKRSGKQFVAEHSYFDHEQGRVRNILMHRFLMRPPDDLVVDHINGNPLDNRRCNLRVCNRQENSWNSRKKRSAHFKGVVKARGGKWCASIQVDGMTIRLGTYEDPSEAAGVYNRAARVVFGDFAKLNDVPDAEEAAWLRCIDRRKADIQRLQEQVDLLEGRAQ